MTSPRKLNTGNVRPVTDYKVRNAEDRNVERQNLNRVLLDIKNRIDALEVQESTASTDQSTSSTSTSGSTTTTTTTTTASSGGASVASPSILSQDFTLAFLLGGV